MRVRLCSTSFQLIAVTFLCAMVVMFPSNLLWAYGGGGGGGGGGAGGGGGGAGGGDGASGQSGALQPLSRQQIENIFGKIGKNPGVSSQTVETLVKALKGKKADLKTLLRLRQRILEIEQKEANFWSGVAGVAVVLVETTDKVGSWTQFALTFVPGVGWATNAGLSVARSGAEAYQKGGDAGQIAKAMTVDGVTQVIMKGSPVGNKSSQYMSRGARGLQSAKGQVSKTLQKMTIRRSKQQLKKGVALGLANTYVSNRVKEGVGHTVTAVQNNAPSPTYTSSRSGGWGPHFAR